MKSAYIDEGAFERRGASGCSNSDYSFVVTTCCAHVGIEDSELHLYYWDPSDLSTSLRMYEASGCPTCGAADWDLESRSENEAPPTAWLWAVRASTQTK
jgi:hypothetical protein